MLFKALPIAIATVLLSSKAHAYSGDGAYSTMLQPLETEDVHPRTPAGTYFYNGGAYGACGSISQDSDFIVALSADQYAGGSNCYRHIGVNCKPAYRARIRSISEY